MDNLDFNLEETEKKGDIYFSNNVTDSAADKKTQSGGKSKSSAKAKQRKLKTKGAGSTYAFFIFVIVASMIISVYAIFCMNDVLAITKNSASVTVSFSSTVESSDDAIDVLHKNGLITCKNFCKAFVKLRDKVISSPKLGGPYDSGVYYLNGKMGLEGMLITLKGDTNKSNETVSLTFPEGYTVPEIVNKLAENDVCDKNSLLSVIQTTDFSYSLVSNLKAQESVPYRLEGYLFPDTYEFFVDESAASTIRKFLENGDQKFTEAYRKQAKKCGYSTYQIMTVASIVQKEAANDDQMKTIAGIIYNRIEDKTNNFPTLGCQSTSDYINNKVKPALSSTSAHTAEYYLKYYNTNNDSTVKGLPAGPICSPGKKAIEAALYPKDTKAMFFFHDTKGNIYTAKTYAEFKEKVATYAPYLSY